MKERKYTPPFLVQMTNGDFNKHCDIYPHGSIHEVKKCNEGYLWITKGIDTIPSDYGVKVIDEKPEVKSCVSCKREYPSDWLFMKIGEDETCVRCYERKYLPNREEYRKIIRKEFKLELNNEHN